MYQIMCNGRPLAVINGDGTLGFFMTQTQNDAENACRKLDGLLGQIRWREVPDPVGFNQKTAKIDNDMFKLPSEGKTLENMKDWKEAEGLR